MIDCAFTGSFWQTYKALIAEFYPPLSHRHGISEKSVAQAEGRLGFKLPSLLRELYLLSGKREDLYQAHDRLVLPNQLRVVGTKLVLYVENQNVVLWAIDRNDSNYDNPPVYRAVNSASLSWEPDHQRLSDYLITMLYWQGVNGGMRYVGVGPLDHDVMLKVATTWNFVPLDLQRWDGMQVFSRKGQILCITNTGLERVLHAAGRTKSDFLNIESNLAMEWDYCTLDDD